MSIALQAIETGFDVFVVMVNPDLSDAETLLAYSRLRDNHMIIISLDQFEAEAQLVMTGLKNNPKPKPKPKPEPIYEQDDDNDDEDELDADMGQEVDVNPEEPVEQDIFKTLDELNDLFK